MVGPDTASVAGRPMASRAPLVFLLLGSGVSSLGNTMAALAIPWYVLTTTGSAALTGVAAFVNGGVLVISALLGGAAIDRIGARRAIVVADLASGVAVALIPLLAGLDMLPFWALLLFVFAGAILDPPGNAARQALLPDLSEPAGVSAERANAAYTTTLQVTQLVGPPLAGLLIVAVGVGGVLWIDVATFAASVVLLLALVPAPDRRRAAMESSAGREGASVGRYFAEVAEGVSFQLRDPLLRVLALTGTALSLLTPPLLGVVLPVYVRTVFGDPVNLGVLLSAYTAGAIASGIVYTTLADRLPRRATLVHTKLFSVVGVALLALRPPLWGMVLAMALAGLSAGPGPAIANAVYQRRTPPAMRGRVFSALIAFALAGGPLGVLLGGFALEAVGVRATLLGLATAFALVWLWLAVDRALPSLERHTEPGGSGQSGE